MAKPPLSTPIKILELSGESWMSGISPQPYLPVGGLFREATNFDPFEQVGVYKTSVTQQQWGSSTVTVAGLYNVGVNISGIGYFYSFGDGSKVYRTNLNGAITNVLDMSTNISGITNIKGVEKFKSRILYAGNTLIKARPLDISSGSEFTVITGLTDNDHIMKIGPDRNLYFTNGRYVGMITDPTVTTGNYGQQCTFEDDIITRDLENDGKYLVIAGDNNINFASGGVSNNRCFVGFWNMKSGDLSQKWEFEDDRVYAIERIEDDILVFARNNIYICNVDSPITVLMPLRGNANITPVPFGPGAVIKRGNNQVLWGTASNGVVHGYGRLTPAFKRIFFKPFTLTTGTISSLFHDGTDVWVMTATPSLMNFGNSTTRQTSTLTLDDVDFKNKYKLAFVKVILKTALASGQSVDVEIKTQSDSRTIFVSSADQFSYANYGAKSSHIFYPRVTGSAGADAPIFEDATNIEITNNGAEISRIEIWASPVGNKQDSGY